MQLIADNLRITRPDVQQALEKNDPDPLKVLTKRCLDAGAGAIDVNTGPLTKNPQAGMRFFVKAVESVTALPLLLDTTNPRAIEAGLDAARNRVIINGFSLEPEKLKNILPLAKTFDTDIVGFLLYPDSRVPKDEAGRFEIALELLEAAEKAGVAKERVIIDPVVPPLAWEDGLVQARDMLAVIKTLPDLLGFPVRTMAGLSNLCTGAVDSRKRLLLEQAYAAMLASAGLTFLLMDFLRPELVQSVRAASLLMESSLFSWGMVPETVTSLTD